MYLTFDKEKNQYSIEIVRIFKTNIEKFELLFYIKSIILMDMLTFQPNIIQWIDWVVSDEINNSLKISSSYNIMKYWSNGPIQTYLDREGCFDEPVAIFYIKQLTSVINLCMKAISLKLILNLKIFDYIFNLKLADFGIAELDYSN